MSKKSIYSVLTIAITVLISGSRGQAEITVPSIFSEGMVLQRQSVVPIWGWGTDNESVDVKLFDHGKVLAQAKTTVKGGKWQVELDNLPAGGRYSLLIQGKNNMILFSNVLVGDVWIICGQSNMLWPVDLSTSAKEAIENRFKYPNIRVALIGKRNPHMVTETQKDTQSFWGPVKWEDATYTVPRSSKTDVPGGSSAVSYYFARELYKYLGNNVPIGMIEVGAIQRVESWVDEETVKNTPQIEHLAGKAYPNATSRCFKANIAPLAPFAVKGAIYYQGEMNAGGKAADYRYGLEALIKSWRKAFHKPELPFLVVQLPGFIVHKGEKHSLDMDKKSLAAFNKNNKNHGFSRIREAQLQVYKNVPNTGLAVTIDLGEAYDIHPPRKREVGERLFMQARKIAYGDRKSLAGGLIPTTFKKVKNGFIVDFENAGTGLATQSGELKGFELKLPDGSLIPASAKIVNESSVEVTAQGGTAPVGVYYSWAGMPDGNLVNKEGLPASPFRFPEEEK